MYIYFPFLCFHYLHIITTLYIDIINTVYRHNMTFEISLFFWIIFKGNILRRGMSEIRQSWMGLPLPLRAACPASLPAWRGGNLQSSQSGCIYTNQRGERRSLEREHSRPEPLNVDTHSRPEPLNVDTHSRPEPHNVDTHSRPEPHNVDTHSRTEPLNVDKHSRREPHNVDTHSRPEPHNVDTHSRTEPLNVDTHSRPEPLNVLDQTHILDQNHST
uniref:Uncharacterized protein n=1 Tax=Oncorhynchus tshawytscha TaxID=74940 RepID=A0AAZ3S7C9_ONCTS